MKNLIVIIAIIFAFSFASSFEIQAFTNVIKEEGTYIIKNTKNIEKQSKKATEQREAKIAEIDNFIPNTEEDIKAGEKAVQNMGVASEAILVLAVVVFAAFYISINYDRRKNTADKQVENLI